jgi:hypothetical protein
MIKQAYGKEALGHSVVFKWHKCFAQGRDSLEDDEHTGWHELNSRSKKLQRWCVPTAPKWQMKSQQQQQGLAMVLATKFCLMT